MNRGAEHGCLFLVVHSAASVLADCAVGVGALPVRVVGAAAIPDHGDRGSRSICVTSGHSVPAGASVARPSRHLNLEENPLW